MMDGKRIVFLDDCQVFNKILIDGYFKNHDLSKVNDLIAFSTINSFFDYVDDESNIIDAFVIDYHLVTVDGLDVVEVLKHKRPEAVIWMYSGMTETHIHDTRRALTARYIHKDKGVSYLFDELLAA